MNAPGHTGERPPPKATILNVNDHPATLYMVSHMLRMAGYQVLESSTGTPRPSPRPAPRRA